MCGIVGTIGFVPDQDSRARALSSMAHRGPDGHDEHLVDGAWLGHRLLAITDHPSAARQPALSRCCQVSLVFNGEIYNSTRLRQRCEGIGYAFTTRSDTEVLLAAYLCWGEQAFQQIEGIYAFGLLDGRDRDVQRLWIARDPMGVKPLYLQVIDDRALLFGSELRACLAISRHENRISTKNLALLLSGGAVPQPRSIYESISSLPPGTIRCYHRQVATGIIYGKEHSFFQPFHLMTQAAESPSISLDETLHAVVGKQLGNIDIAHLFLSGGMDSALLGAMIAKFGATPHCHTLSLATIAPALDESKGAHALAQQMSWKHCVHEPDDSEILQHYRKFIAIIDQPSVDGFNSFLAASCARNLTKVVYSGTGPDELLFGYPWMTDIYQAFTGREVTTPMLAAAWASRTSIFSTDEIQQLMGIDSSHVEGLHHDSLIEADPGPAFPLYERIRSLCLHRFTLDRLLRDIDITGMCNGLEIRVPFLDQEFVKVCRQIGNFLNHSGESSRDTLYRGIKAPLVTVARNYLPRSFLEQEKRGFHIPYDKFLRGPLRLEVLPLFQEVRTPMFDEYTLRRYWREFIQGRRSPLQIWLLAVVLGWQATSV